MAISGNTLGGTDTGDFSETSTCGSSRTAMVQSQPALTFKPAAAVARRVTLNIKGGVGTQSVQLSGTGK
jgi:hypothetical protein